MTFGSWIGDWQPRRDMSRSACQPNPYIATSLVGGTSPPAQSTGLRLDAAGRVVHRVPNGRAEAYCPKDGRTSDNGKNQRIFRGRRAAVVPQHVEKRLHFPCPDSGGAPPPAKAAPAATLCQLCASSRSPARQLSNRVGRCHSPNPEISPSRRPICRPASGNPRSVAPGGPPCSTRRGACFRRRNGASDGSARDRRNWQR